MNVVFENRVRFWFMVFVVYVTAVFCVVLRVSCERGMLECVFRGRREFGVRELGIYVFGIF